MKRQAPPRVAAAEEPRWTPSSAIDRARRLRYRRLVTSIASPRRKMVAKPARVAAKRRVASGVAGAGEPLRVLLPVETRAKLAEQASRRGIDIEAVAFALIDERLREIDASHELTVARDWQRGQALSTLEKIRAGDLAEVSEDEIESDFADALSASRRRRG